MAPKSALARPPGDFRPKVLDRPKLQRNLDLVCLTLGLRGTRSVPLPRASIWRVSGDVKMALGDARIHTPGARIGYCRGWSIRLPKLYIAGPQVRMSPNPTGPGGRGKKIPGGSDHCSPRPTPVQLRPGHLKPGLVTRDFHTRGHPWPGTACRRSVMPKTTEDTPNNAPASSPDGPGVKNPPVVLLTGSQSPSLNGVCPTCWLAYAGRDPRAGGTRDKPGVGVIACYEGPSG